MNSDGPSLLTLGTPVAAVQRRPTPGGQDQLIPLYDNADPADWGQACSQANGSGDGSWIIVGAAAEGGPGSGPVPAWARAMPTSS
jgi:hypothetical protein